MSNSASTVTVPQVTLFNNGDEVGSASVVNGQWTVTVTGLALGPQKLTAQAGDAASRDWSFEVRPPALDDTDFEDGTWGGWKIFPEFYSYRLASSGSNTFASATWVSTSYNRTTLFEKTISGFSVGQRYRIEARVKSNAAEAGIWITAAGLENGPADPVPNGDWHLKWREFTATQTQLACALAGEKLAAGDIALDVDNIRVFRVA